jgi:hypothetical protein
VNCSTVTIAKHPGEIPGLPRTPNAAANHSSWNSSPSSSRIRIAGAPFGNAARAIRAVNSGTPTGRRGRIDTTHPILWPIRTTREDDHTKIIQRDDQQAQRQPRRVTGKLGNRVKLRGKHLIDKPGNRVKAIRKHAVIVWGAGTPDERIADRLIHAYCQRRISGNGNGHSTSDCL